MSEKTNSTFSWGANEIAKRIKVVFGFCLFPAALCLVNGNATGLLSLLLLAESFGLLYAFKAAEIENSKKLVRILKILAPVTLAYSLYLGVMTFVRAINGDFVDGLLGRVVASSDIAFIIMAFICFFTAESALAEAYPRPEPQPGPLPWPQLLLSWYGVSARRRLLTCAAILVSR